MLPEYKRLLFTFFKIVYVFNIDQILAEIV